MVKELFKHLPSLQQPELQLQSGLNQWRCVVFLGHHMNPKFLNPSALAYYDAFMGADGRALLSSCSFLCHLNGIHAGDAESHEQGRTVETYQLLHLVFCTRGCWHLPSWPSTRGDHRRPLKSNIRVVRGPKSFKVQMNRQSWAGF